MIVFCFLNGVLPETPDGRSVYKGEPDGLKTQMGQLFDAMLQQMQWALGEQQLSDAAGIRGEVASGVVALKDRLAAAISDSAQKIQAVLNARLQELDSTVTQVCMM